MEYDLMHVITRPREDIPMGSEAGCTHFPSHSPLFTNPCPCGFDSRHLHQSFRGLVGGNGQTQSRSLTVYASRPRFPFVFIGNAGVIVSGKPPRQAACRGSRLRTLMKGALGRRAVLVHSCFLSFHALSPWPRNGRVFAV